MLGRVSKCIFLLYNASFMIMLIDKWQEMFCQHNSVAHSIQISIDIANRVFTFQLMPIQTIAPPPSLGLLENIRLGSNLSAQYFASPSGPPRKNRPSSVNATFVQCLTHFLLVSLHCFNHFWWGHLFLHEDYWFHVLSCPRLTIFLKNGFWKKRNIFSLYYFGLASSSSLLFLPKWDRPFHPQNRQKWLNWSSTGSDIHNASAS